MTTNLRAALTVCDYANNPDEARELLDMLGLISGGNITDDFTRVIELDRPDAKGPGARSEYNLHERGDGRSSNSTVPDGLRNLAPWTSEPVKAPQRQLAACGTKAARRRHRNRGETCEACVRPPRTVVQVKPRVAKPSRRRVAQCGTNSGYKRHRANGETACDSCKEAHSRSNRPNPAPRPIAGPCGTISGYSRHKRAGETPCRECKDVANERVRERRLARAVAKDEGLAACGTVAAWRRHKRRQEACTECGEARDVRDQRARSGAEPRFGCGTRAAAKRHLKLGEPVCDPCREAKRAYDRDTRKRAA